MSFYGKNFLYNGISSEIYGLICASIDSSGQESSSAGNDVEIIEEYILRRETPYFYGVSYPSKLEFQISFFSEEPIPRERVREIQMWLFGQPTYKQFKILQEDLMDVHYNCIFTENSIITVGNEVVGFSTTAKCDSSWAWGDTIALTKTNATGSFAVSNKSDSIRYTKPTLTLTFTSNQSNVSIQNTSDTGRAAMIFSTVTSGEIITINNDLQTISSNRELIVDRFNSKYFYLVPGTNNITITGTVGTFVMSYIPARKVGA
ncbi:MAG: hypothetical protein PHE93_06560 [Clostridia bacterium]|nr:hypothetical protein [Clostridia bacterium]